MYLDEESPEDNFAQLVKKDQRVVIFRASGFVFASTVRGSPQKALLVLTL